MAKRKSKEVVNNLPEKKDRVSVDNGSRTKNNKGSSGNDKVKKHLDDASPKKKKDKKLNYSDQNTEKLEFSIDKDELTMNDITQMCHGFVTKKAQKRPTWMKFDDKFKMPKQMIFTRINCTEEQMDDENKQLAFVKKFFEGNCNSVSNEILDSSVYWNGLMNVCVSKKEQLKRFFETRHDAIKEFQQDDDVKLSLLTTIEEMAALDYPLHGFEKDISGVACVVPTKDHYAKVTKKSPIFVLDCEMCVTDINEYELTRVTMLDESGKIVLDTFVKPVNKIVDYVTCFSGVTENALRDCSVTLQDVQETFRRILPVDAILCGHAIENDLKALRLSHPYCIDTSFAYNIISGQRKVRSSLRGLMYYFFNEHVQSSDLGHCSYEDAWSSLRLLKLKLENGKSFGLRPDGFNYIKWAKKQGFHECVKTLLRSDANVFARDPMRSVTLPKPREIGKCVTCKISIKSQCFIKKCLCVKQKTLYCCICVGKEVKHKELIEKNRFDFGNAISCLKEISYRITMQETLKEYKKPTKALIAKYLTDTENVEEMTDENVHVYDMNSYESLPEIEKKLFDEKITDHNLCLLEYDARSLKLSDIDDYLRALHQRIDSNVIFGALLCSPQKAILYINVKSRC